MTERLQRFLLFTVLLSLGLNGRFSAMGSIWSGIFNVPFVAEPALPFEEEVESDSETHLYLFSSVDCINGGGGDDDLEIEDVSEDNPAPTPNFSSPYLAIFPRLFTEFGSISKSQIDANTLQLASASKPELYLLYHNFKPDLGKPTFA